MAAMTSFAWITQMARSFFSRSDVPAGHSEAIELQKQVSDLGGVFS